MIFVFGSNLAGIHGAGAAKFALQHHGAIWGQGEGLQGNSYALPTKDKNIKSLTLDQITLYIERFLSFARSNRDKTFLLTPIGTGLAGFSRQEIAQILYDSEVPINVVLSREWIRDYD